MHMNVRLQVHEGRLSAVGNSRAFSPRWCGDVAPSPDCPHRPRDGEREVVMARWGLIPFWMKERPKVPQINARAETVHKLPLSGGFC